MSEHDTLSLMAQYSLVKIAGMSLVVSILKLMLDFYDSKKK